MLLKDSYCSYCGSKYQNHTPWPRACQKCGKKSYINPLPVVVAIVPVLGGLLAVRRNIEPCKGSLTLPGGYLDIGETWQEGSSRELLEETGVYVKPEEFTLYDVENGLDNTIVILGIAPTQPLDYIQPFSSDETQEVTLLKHPQELGFPLHTKVLASFFAQQSIK